MRGKQSERGMMSWRCSPGCEQDHEETTGQCYENNQKRGWRKPQSVSFERKKESMVRNLYAFMNTEYLTNNFQWDGKRFGSNTGPIVVLGRG